MTNMADAAMLRRLADALDSLGETRERTGVTLCAYGSDHLTIDDITLRLDTVQEGDSLRYVVDLSGQ